MCPEFCERLIIFSRMRRSMLSGKCWILAGRLDMRFTTSTGLATSSCCLSWTWSCGCVSGGDFLDVGARGGYRGGGDSIDVDGGSDGSAAHGFAGRQKANRPVSSRTLGLVERIVG